MPACGSARHAIGWTWLGFGIKNAAAAIAIVASVAIEATVVRVAAVDAVRVIRPAPAAAPTASRDQRNSTNNFCRDGEHMRHDLTSLLLAG